MSYAPNFDPRTGKYSMPKRSMRRRRAIPIRGSTLPPDPLDFGSGDVTGRQMVEDIGEPNVSYAPRPRPRVKPKNLNPNPKGLPDFQVPPPIDPVGPKPAPREPKIPSPKMPKGPQGSKPATRAPRAPRGPQSVAPRGPKGPKGPSPKAQKVPKSKPKAQPRRRAQVVKPKPTPKASPRRRVIPKKR
jgi:hypothetical protein